MRRNIPVLVGLLAVFGCGRPQLAPNVPRKRARPVIVTPESLSRGLALVGEARCQACHESFLPGPPRSAPLETVGARLRPTFLRGFLRGEGVDGLAPHSPELFSWMDAYEREETVEDIVHHLVSKGGGVQGEPLVVAAGSLEAGRQLYHRVGCVACHEPYEPAENLERALWEFEDVVASSRGETTAIASSSKKTLRPFGDLRRKTRYSALAAYLADPLAVHPSGRMPSLSLTLEEADAIAAYIWFELGVDEGLSLEEGPGLVFERFEESFAGAGHDFAALTPVAHGVVADLDTLPEHPEDDFGFVFRGFLTVPADGTYTFATSSDDGSLLYVDGEVVVDNDGQHGMVEESGQVWLEKGRHTLEITWFEHLGGEGLEITWQGPGFEAQPLPARALTHWRGIVEPLPEPAFTVDTERARRGAERYVELNCGACHDAGSAAVAAPGLEALAFNLGGGCLAPAPLDGLPRYRLAPREREDLHAALTWEGPTRPDHEALLHATMRRLDCVACHQRAELGAPAPEKRAYFFVDTDAELGDEGRIPPQLDRVGSKLEPEWIAAVLKDGKRVRPYMQTRMPLFGEENVRFLPALLAAHDGRPGDDLGPEFSVEAVEAGQRLVGTKGLGCIQCHDFAGHPSLGIPAVDLALVRNRIRPGWFRELLMDPGAINMNTRMPSFMTDGASPVRDLYDGDPALQVDAIWTYLQLGNSMPYPEGLLPAEEEYELEIGEEPVTVGVFMKGVSPRTVLVGYPERVHVAFDVQGSRLAKAWRGRYFNARGTWHGRAGELEEPMGADVVDFAPGAPFALLANPEDAWPTETGRDAGYRVIGRRYDTERRPQFLYSIGEVEVEEQPYPFLREGGAALVRRFVLQSRKQVEGLFLRVAVGDAVRRSDDGVMVVAGDPELRIRLMPERFREVRREDGRVELRVPVEMQPLRDSFLADLRVEVMW